MSFFLENVNHDRVELPEAVAKRHFKTVADADAIVNLAAAGRNDDPSQQSPPAQAEDAEDVEDDDASVDEDAVPLRMSELEYDKVTLEQTVAYAMLPDDERTVLIPKPLTRSLVELVTPGEMQFMQRAERGDYLIQLLDIASYLKFDQLVNLCAAYISVRIDDISRHSKSIMDGAEKIRAFLHMENEWTAEEMEHLRKEMEYAKQVDPRVY